MRVARTHGGVDLEYLQPLARQPALERWQSTWQAELDVDFEARGAPAAAALPKAWTG